MYHLPVEEPVVCGPPTTKQLSQCVPNQSSSATNSAMPSSPEFVTSPDPDKKTTPNYKHDFKI